MFKWLNKPYGHKSDRRCASRTGKLADGLFHCRIDGKCCKLLNNPAFLLPLQNCDDDWLTTAGTRRQPVDVNN